MVTKITPLKAIKEYCKEQCCAGELHSWKECLDTDCPLHAFRMGKKEKK